MVAVQNANALELLEGDFATRVVGEALIALEWLLATMLFLLFLSCAEVELELSSYLNEHGRRCSCG